MWNLQTELRIATQIIDVYFQSDKDGYVILELSYYINWAVYLIR